MVFSKSAEQRPRRVFGASALAAALVGLCATGVSSPTQASATTATSDGRSVDIRQISVGSQPGPIAINSLTGTIYVGNQGSGTISVLDGRSNTVLGSVTVGAEPSDIAVNEKTQRVYISNSVAGTISVLNGSTNTVLTTIAAGPGASTIDVDEASNRIYVGSEENGSVSVLDGVSNTLLTTVDSPASGFSDVKVDAGRQVAYFSQVKNDSIEVFDTAKNAFTGSIKTGKAPTSLVMQPIGNTLYVGNAGIHHLSVIDGASKAESTKIKLRSEASSVAIHEATNTIYTNGGPNGITKIDGTKKELTGELSLGINPGQVAVNQYNKTVYVTDPIRNSVSVITNF